MVLAGIQRFTVPLQVQPTLKIAVPYKRVIQSYTIQMDASPVSIEGDIRASHLESARKCF